LGNPVYAGQIFDPRAVAADGFTRAPFTNNTIPSSRFADELGRTQPGLEVDLPGLSPVDRRTVADLAQFLAERRHGRASTQKR
jgi:hypothetical protein